MRYSLTYIERTSPITDSERFRRRLYHAQISTGGIADFLSAELGIPVSSGSSGGVGLSFFLKAELKDVLDFVTLSVVYLIRRPFPKSVIRNFIQTTQRILDEENLAFMVDDDGRVHPRIDAAFAAISSSAVSALAGTRYSNVRAQFELCEGFLNTDEPDYKHGLRAMFSANEGLFRLIAPKAPKLAVKEIRDYLSPLIERHYHNDLIAKRSAAKIITSYCEWVDSVHFYRHEQGQEEPVQPPQNLAVLLISQGISYLRWLADVDRLLVQVAN